MKELLERIKTDPILKQKLIKASVVFGVVLLGIIGYMIYSSSNSQEQNGAIKEKNVITGRIVPADTTAVNVQKEIFYNDSDSIAGIHNSSSTVLGGSMVEQQQQTQINNNAIDNYMNQRQQSVSRMQNSSAAPTYSSSPSYSRRSYNPNGNSSDWTSDATSVTGTRITTDQPVIKQRSYNPDNPMASASDAPTAYQPAQAVQKPMTKEEKLRAAIANKYNGKSGGKTTIAAQIYSNQKITQNNSSVRIVLLEKLPLPDGTFIGTDAFVWGQATSGGNNIAISVPTISYRGRNYQVDLDVFDYRTGEKGIPIKSDNIVGAIKDQAQGQAASEISRAVGRLGGIGNIIGSVLSGRSNSTTAIQLNEGHRIYLKTRQQ